MQESLKQVFLNLNLESFIPYVENTTYLVLIFIFLTIVLFYLINYVAKFFITIKKNQLKEKNPH